MESLPNEKCWTDGDYISAEYTCNFMPKAIVNQLSAELSEYILITDDSEEVWNNAVNFVYSAYGKTDKTGTQENSAWFAEQIRQGRLSHQQRHAE